MNPWDRTLVLRMQNLEGNEAFSEINDKIKIVKHEKIEVKSRKQSGN